MTRLTIRFMGALAPALLLAGAIARGAPDAPPRESTIRWVHRSRVELATTNHRAALEFARHAVETDPAYAEAWKQLGRVAMLQGRLQLALEALDTAAELHPDDPDVARWRPALYRDLGWAGSAAGDWDGAAAWFDRALSQPIGQRQVLIRSAFVALSESPHPERAAPFLERWTGTGAAREMGDELARAGRWAAAEQAWAAAWRDPALRAHLAPRLLFARMLNRTIRCEESPSLLAAMSPAPGAPTPEEFDMAAEGIMPCRHGEDGGPEPDLPASGAAPTPRITDQMESAARRQQAMRNYGSAARLFSRVFQRDPDRRSYVRAAAALEALRGRAAAIDFLDHLRGRCTEEAVRLGVQGFLSHLGGKTDAAAELFRASIALDPAQPDLRREYFSTLLALGRTNDAMAQLTWFAERQQADDDAARPALAEMWSAMGRDDEALRFWNALIEAHPASPYYAVEKARTLLRAGHPADALRTLLALTQRTADAQAYELIAGIHLEAGRVAEALEALDAGLALEYTPGLLALRARITDSPLPGAE